jgi:phosphocarrier protein
LEDIVIEKILTVKNRAGIHARPASLIAQLANKFQSEITLEKDSIAVNAKSIMGVITMAAGYNTTITLKVEGSDEQDAANAIEKLFEGKFEEE